MVAILLIPHFLKIGTSDEQNDLDKVLGVLISFQDDTSLSAPKLTREFLKQVLEFHGELGITDKVNDEMMQAASGEGKALDAASLL